MAPTKLKAHTYRVEGIPYGTTESELKRNFFYKDDQDDLYVKSLYPSVESVEGEEGDLTATVLFRPHEPQPDGPRAQDPTITVDKDFAGFTPLYVPSPGKGPIAADIIAVTGLQGHAFESWAHAEDRMWLRDYLKDYAGNARILTYGYSTRLHNSTSFSVLQDHASKFVHSLVDMREEAQCESRPIIFIGHSLGCLIIKKALTDAGSIGINASRLPVRAIIFLAAPHKGLDVAALQTIVHGQPSEMMIMELKPGSPSLGDLNNRFAQMAQEIDILTVYESKLTKTALQGDDGNWYNNGPPVMMVTADSAQLYYLKEHRVAADTDHADIAKVKKGQAGIFSHIKSAIRHALRPTADIVADVSQAPQVDFRLHNSNTEGWQETPRNLHVLEQSRVVPPPVYYPGSEDLLRSKSMPLQITAREIDQPPIPITMTTRNDRPDELPKNESGAYYYRANEEAKLSAPPMPMMPPDTASIYSVQSDEPAAYPYRPAEIARSVSAPSSDFVHYEQSTPVSTVSERFVEPLPQLSTKPVVRDEPEIAATLPHQSAKPQEPKGPKYNNKSNVETVGDDQKFCEDLPLCTCATCLEEISNTDYHWRCLDCLDPGDEDNGLCTKCYITDSLCKTHGEELFKVSVKMKYGFFHYVAAVNDKVSTFDTSMVAAIKKNDVDQLKLVARNVRLLNAKSSDGATPLHLACQLGRVECVRILLLAGAQKEARESTNDTPLLVAIDYDYLEVVQVLLEDGVNVENIGGSKEASPLTYATHNGQSDIVKLLLEHGAKTDPRNYNDSTPLHLATFQGDETSVNLLLDAGANLNARDKVDGDTPLHNAAGRGHSKIVQILLDHGANIEMLSTEGYTALDYAVEYGKTSVTRILLSAGANVHYLSPNEETPLHIAARLGYVTNLNLLLEYGADIEAENQAGVTPLLMSAMNGQVSTCQALLNAHANIEAIRPIDKKPILTLACVNKKSNPGVIELLLNHGARVDAIDHENYTCLHWAAEFGKTAIVEVLLKHRASMTRKAGPCNALHLAVTYSQLPTIRLLLKHGANPNAIGKGGATPLYTAALCGSIEIMGELLDAGADINKEMPWGEDWDNLSGGLNAVEGAAYGGYVDAVRFLLGRGASGKPPGRLEGKWKNLTFADGVEGEVKKEVLRVLRGAKHS